MTLDGGLREHAPAVSGESDVAEVIHQPLPDACAASQLTAFIDFVTTSQAVSFPSYADFEEWAAREYRDFWRLFVSWSGISVDGVPEPVCTSDEIETARFFPGLRLNYAQSLLYPAPDPSLPRGELLDDPAADAVSDADADADLPAITSCRAGRPAIRLTRGELRLAVVRAAAALTELGLREGDRVAAIVRNTADAVVTALAVAAVGATFSSAATDMGSFGALSRFRQLDPTFLIGHVTSPTAAGSTSVAERLAEVAAGLPTLTHVIVLDGGEPEAAATTRTCCTHQHTRGRYRRLDAGARAQRHRRMNECWVRHLSAESGADVLQRFRT